MVQTKPYVTLNVLEAAMEVLIWLVTPAEMLWILSAMEGKTASLTAQKDYFCMEIGAVLVKMSVVKKWLILMQKQSIKNDPIKSIRVNVLNIAHPKLKNFRKMENGLVRNAMIALKNA